MTNDNKTQSKPEKRKCKLCGSTLRAIGKDRANGKPGRKGAFSDWSSRQYHKHHACNARSPIPPMGDRASFPHVCTRT